ncbi:Lrp/AsnC family transcriptional regulator [Desulfogranum mediterraneum]|uniref:Lrp/AsnC family transcriptional regulator n=1 Tax=Desulfogranum mediterraneum TaxID=160661 RepID=UPI0004057529|nr:Lrp/AsnC family transcriptional regulator [Desulfogranum mediterraneum]
MDDTDRQILAALQTRARIKNSELARELQLAATTLQERIRRLEERGIIRGYQAVIEPEKIGLHVQAFVGITLDRHEAGDIQAFEQAIKRCSNITACYHVSGRFDYLLQVVAEDLQQLGKLVKVEIASLPDFGRSETFLAFSEIESAGMLPLDEQ